MKSMTTAELLPLDSDKADQVAEPELEQASANQRGKTQPACRWIIATLILAIAAGAVLRFLWLGDIEYKGDEDFSAYFALEAGQAEAWPPIGMESSVGIPNYGLSVWLFVGVARVLAATSPPELAGGVAVCSLVAMVLYIPFIRRLIGEPEREAWYWGVALMAVNPLAVFLHRKIWPPSLFPLLTLPLLTGWMCRGRPWGALLFGLFGVLLGQVQMGGFFLTAALVLWALLFDGKSLRWRWWFLGSLLGALPTVPWLIWLNDHPAALATRGESTWLHALQGLFWIRWIAQPYGFETLNHTLGADFWDFLRYPLIAGYPTFIVGVLHLLSALLLVKVAAGSVRRLWDVRQRWREMFIGRSSATAFTLAAAFWGFGMLFALTGRPLRYQYMLVSMPLIFVWAARAILCLQAAPGRLLLSSRRCLLVLCIFQGLIALAFLDYIHVNQHNLRGDYGVPYAAQAPHQPIGAMSRVMRAKMD
jgi:hypothetical protein